MSEIDIDLDTIDTSEDIGLGEEDKGKVNSNQVEWYKGEKGRTDRVALIYFNNVRQTVLRKAIKQKPDLTKEQQKAVVIQVLQKLAESKNKTVDQLDAVDELDLTEARFRTFSSSYKQGVGYVEWPKKLSAEEERVWKKLGDKKDYVSTLLLVYPTDKEGEIVRERLATGWTVKPWRFPAKIYDAIRKINRGQAESGNSVASLDLTISCEDTQYQKLQILPAGPSIYLKNDKLKRMVLEKAVTMYDKLNPFRQLTTDELREKLGLGGGSTGGGSSESSDFSDVLSNI
jgi:hypothetical protein